MWGYWRIACSKQTQHGIAEGIMDCQDIVFSPQQSEKRINRALKVIPSQVLKKILSFSFYLLGARHKAISSLLEIPEDSIKTTISRVMKDGVSAFCDRRQSDKANKLPLSPAPQQSQVSVRMEEDYCAIIFGGMEHQLIIPRNHRVHLRSVLLSLLQANLITANTASSALALTAAHCRDLSTRLMHDGVTEVLIDQRKGQKQDIHVDLSVKADLIQYFAARAVTGHSTSSQTLTEIINDIKKTNISPRTIRWHMNKLGLMTIKNSLPELVKILKKKS